MPLALSSLEKSVTIQNYKQININDISTPCLLACVDNNRLRIGHSRLTHSYLIGHQGPPKCRNCNQKVNLSDQTTVNSEKTKSQIISIK